MPLRYNFLSGTDYRHRSKLCMCIFSNIKKNHSGSEEGCLTVIHRKELDGVSVPVNFVSLETSLRRNRGRTLVESFKTSADLVLALLMTNCDFGYAI